MKNTTISLLLASTLTVPVLAVENKGYWMSPPLSGYAHLTRYAKDNFLFPNVQTQLSASLEGVDAKLVMNAPAFPLDGCINQNVKSDAILQITKQGKTLLKHKFSDFDSLSGPQLTANLKAPPTVTIDAIIPKQPEYQNFDFDKSTGQYKKQTSENGPASDDSKQHPPIRATRIAKTDEITAIAKWNCEFGNLNCGGDKWTLEIKRDGKVGWSSPIDVPIEEKRENGTVMECFGPVILSLDQTGKPKVLMRCGVAVEDADGQDDMRYVELIFYYDSASRRFKCSTHAWGNVMPHLADHEHDGQIEFITQNFEFAKALWKKKDARLTSGSGGPIQFWRWSEKEGKLVERTRDYPKQIKRHAAASLTQFTSEPNRPDCYLIGYVADLLLLGQKDLAMTELAKRQTKNTKAQNSEILSQLKKFGYLETANVRPSSAHSTSSKQQEKRP
jgi:hypothetical protein